MSTLAQQLEDIRCIEVDTPNYNAVPFQANNQVTKWACLYSLIVNINLNQQSTAKNKGPIFKRTI